MRVSAGLPTGMEGLTYPIPFSDPQSVIDIALAAEKFGYDSVWGNDHMTTQNYVRAEFPVPPRFWEPLVTYAYLASITKTLRFGTGILVLPMRRDIVVTAKQICTLDHFSGGRLEIGIGIGAYREEFDALQPDSQLQRGDIVEEGLQALTKLLTDRVASFDGAFYRYRDVELWPKPMQKRIPILVGGNNPNNIRRAVEHATGWLPAGLHISKVRAGVALLKEHAERIGRDWREIEVAPQFIVRVDRDRAKAVRDFEASQMYKHLVSLKKSTLKDQGDVKMEDSNLVGTPAEIVDKANALKEAGVTHLLGLYFAADSVKELIDQMQLFAEEVVPHLK
jgi:probable F420-dependent oxidoreductase